MDNKFIAATLLLISGCSHNPDLAFYTPPLKPEAESIQTPILAFVATPQYASGSAEQNHFLSSVDMSIPEAPIFEPRNFICGWMPGPESYVLENADIAFRLQGVYEAWTPIGGTQKKYFVFRLMQ